MNGVMARLEDGNWCVNTGGVLCIIEREKKMTKKLVKLFNHILECGYTAITYGSKTIRITVSIFSINSLMADIKAKGYKAWIVAVPELGQFPICNDLTMSGKDTAAYLFVM
jgi:hypothetical protein